jgi:hypothetical protein
VGEWAGGVLLKGVEERPDPGQWYHRAWGGPGTEGERDPRSGTHFLGSGPGRGSRPPD